MELIMQSRKLILVFGIAILLVGAAAFVAGRMLNTETGSLGFFGRPVGNAGANFISIDDIVPAPELPTIPSELTGLFVERKDNTVIIQEVSFDPGLGGMLNNSPLDENSGPKVEVVVTGETTVYRETTDFGQSISEDHVSFQQTVEEDTLDHLTAQSMITVWGRRNGDRVIAEVLLYMNPLMIKKPAQ
jgi:hypothetical protein